MLRLILFVLLGSMAFSSYAQPKKPTSSQIYDALERLNVLGTVLYIAAHPDDENTRLISYMANEKNYRTGYLSLTRGDGGQNLIGTEIRELLGIIRTNELLQARKTDGGVQMFTRANDFGYSKHPDETLEIWNKDEVLSDVVWAIRNFKPDIIVNRFDHRTPGRTHGHHTSSAMLSVEAFDLVGDKKAYPNQLKLTDEWQPARLFFNTSWWFYGSRENFENADKSRMVSLDVGGYNPKSGLSSTEIASLSRSMHKSQGFGSTGTRGSLQEYLETIKGDVPPNNADPMSGINTTWSRVQGGDKVQVVLDKILDSYDFKSPGASMQDLVELYSLIEATKDEHWRAIKLEELTHIISWCAGLYIEAVTDDAEHSPGGNIDVNIELINRCSASISVQKIAINGMGLDTTLNLNLEENQPYLITKKGQIDNNIAYTNAYWLNEAGTLGMYKVDDQSLIGNPISDRSLKINYTLNIEGKEIPFESDVVFKRNDRVDGEVYRPVEIIPLASVNIDQPVYVFDGSDARTVEINVAVNQDNFNGELHFDIPADWKVEPHHLEIKAERKGQTVVSKVKLTPPSSSSDGNFRAYVVSNGKRFDKALTRIDYDHIPYQMVYQPAQARVVKIDLKKSGNHIAYLEGAGDVVADHLRNIGYDVTLLDPSTLMSTDLSGYDAVVVGIRAFNTLDELKFANESLFEYVHQGGTLLVQYNTSRGLVTDDIAPYPLRLGRDRITDEYAPMTILQPEHAVFNYPNTITSQDFDGWVQERGLYFADQWDEHLTPLLSGNDKGEDPKQGSLLVAKYGQGYYIYSGISWFRQLPAGVPGAFRLLVNVISLGNEAENE